MSTIIAPVYGRIEYGPKGRYIEHLYDAHLEESGIFINFWLDNADNSPLVIFFGSRWTGPFAVWHAGHGAPHWQACFSKGNFGRNYADGGAWSAAASLSRAPDFNSGHEAIAYRFSDISKVIPWEKSRKPLLAIAAVNRIVSCLGSLKGFEGLQNPLLKEAV